VVATESVEGPESRVESPDPEDTAPQDAAPEASWRGEGDPPAGFTIKGKEASMLIHRPDSSMYGRTKADVWFKTEEDAVAAGFKMAKTHPKSRESTVESQEQEDTPDSGLSTQDSSASDSEGGAG
jgi:hypothetical protein